ncbi:MAG TPA: Scr1 family TA system antitoxin-like transcriptional regulator [Streptosporangiaceae bacterium]
MTSPFVRRRRLAVELRALREERGLTAEQVARRIHQSRMKISKLENAHIRPDLAEVMKILDLLEVTGERWHDIIRIARDAAERGWWDSYGDAMGSRQRMYADLESGAKTIHEYHQATIPAVLQTPDFVWFMIEMAKAEDFSAGFATLAANSAGSCLPSSVARTSVSPMTRCGSTSVSKSLLATSATVRCWSVVVPPAAMVADVPTHCRSRASQASRTRRTSMATFSALTPAVGVQLVEDQKAQTLRGADQTLPFSWPGEHQLEHHVIGQQDVRRIT